MEKVDFNGYEMTKNLKALIENSIEDNKISDAERRAIHNKAYQEGFSTDEIDILLDSLISSRKKQKKKARSEFWTKKDKKGTPNYTYLIMGVIFFGLVTFVIIANSLSTSEYEENVELINEAITSYNIEEARNLLGEFEAMDPDGRTAVHKYKVTELYVKAYKSEIDYYLKNDKYDLSISSISEFYNICASRPFEDASDDGGLLTPEGRALELDEVMNRYYYPEVTKLISKLESDGQDDKLIGFVKSIPHAKTKEKVLSGVN